MKTNHTNPDVTGANEGQLRKATFDWITQSLKQNPKAGDRLVDLGAGPCIFAKLAHKNGYDVTAVDSRTERLPEGLDGIRFFQSNVNDFDLTKFDVVVVLGLLYHLTLDDQINLMERVSKKGILILDTQVHMSEHVQVEASVTRGFDTDAIVKKKGYEGVLFPEIESPISSVGNLTSWWHTEQSLMRMLDNTGFVEATVVGEPYISKYGARRWIVASKTRRTIKL